MVISCQAFSYEKEGVTTSPVGRRVDIATIRKTDTLLS